MEIKPNHLMELGNVYLGKFDGKLLFSRYSSYNGTTKIPDLTGQLLSRRHRVITFFLACLLCGAVCIGLLVAIAAGVAYGYNYSMAEFLTFTKQDVTVYMRRGQFYDKPDIDLDREMFSRRRSDGGDVVENYPGSLYSYNKTVDYQEHHQNLESKPLPDAWKQVKDTRKYADVLTKYISNIMAEPDIPEHRIQTSKRPNPISVTANPLVRTTVLRHGSSKIVMRNFRPGGDIINYETTTSKQNDEFFYPDTDERRSKGRVDYPVEKESQTTDIRIRVQDSLRQNVPMMRHWRTTEKSFGDDLLDVDEDNVVYKPV